MPLKPAAKKGRLTAPFLFSVRCLLRVYHLFTPDSVTLLLNR